MSRGKTSREKFGIPCTANNFTLHTLSTAHTRTYDDRLDNLYGPDASTVTAAQPSVYTREKSGPLKQGVHYRRMKRAVRSATAVQNLPFNGRSLVSPLSTQCNYTPASSSSSCFVEPASAASMKANLARRLRYLEAIRPAVVGHYPTLPPGASCGYHSINVELLRSSTVKC